MRESWAMNLEKCPDPSRLLSLDSSLRDILRELLLNIKKLGSPCISFSSFPETLLLQDVCLNTLTHTQAIQPNGKINWLYSTSESGSIPSKQQLLQRIVQNGSFLRTVGKWGKEVTNKRKERIVLGQDIF